MIPEVQPGTCGERSEVPVVSTDNARNVFEAVGMLYVVKISSLTKGS